MNKNQAIVKLRAILGRDLAYRINPKVPVGEQREANLQCRIALTEDLRVAKEAAEARRREILADPEYQRLQGRVEELRRERDSLYSADHHRIEVGTSSDVGGLGFFHIRASGDNWAEVVAKLTEIKAK